MENLALAHSKRQKGMTSHVRSGSCCLCKIFLCFYQAVGGRPPRHASTPPPCAPKRLAPPSRPQRSSSFPRPTCSDAHRYSCQTHQHGGEQSGLVTLTFDLLTLKVASESRVTWATCIAIFGLPRRLCSRLRPDVRDRKTSDKSIA